MKIASAASAALVACGLAAGAAQAAPVEYVRICSAFGPEYFYSPGTDTCINANTGETRTATENGVHEGTTDIVEGIALSIAMPSPYIQPGDNFALAARWGMIDGASALGFGFAARISDSITINATIGFGLGTEARPDLEHSVIGSQIGINIAW